MIQTFTIEGFLPLSANRRERQHWNVRARTMRRDGELVAHLVRVQGITPATGKRRVSISLEQARGRLRDPDGCLKTMLDHLVRAKLLRDDSAMWCEIGSVTIARGKSRRTVITLEDIDDCSGVIRPGG